MHCRCARQRFMHIKIVPDGFIFRIKVPLFGIVCDIFL